MKMYEKWDSEKEGQFGHAMLNKFCQLKEVVSGRSTYINIWIAQENLKAPYKLDQYFLGIFRYARKNKKWYKKTNTKFANPTSNHELLLSSGIYTSIISIFPKP